MWGPTIFVVILIVRLRKKKKLWLWKFLVLVSCRPSVDLHYEMSPSLFFRLIEQVAFGCEMSKCHGWIEACSFYTNDLFIIKECFTSRCRGSICLNDLRMWVVQSLHRVSYFENWCLSTVWLPVWLAPPCAGWCGCRLLPSKINFSGKRCFWGAAETQRGLRALSTTATIGTRSRVAAETQHRRLLVHMTATKSHN